jgi:hypothetical protein
MKVLYKSGRTCVKLSSKSRLVKNKQAARMRKYWFLIVLIMAAACSGKDTKIDSAAYQKTKGTLADKEKDNPTGFLTITAKDKKSLFGIGRQTIVKGTIKNVASVVTYKDVRVKMLCFDKAGNRIEEHEDVMDDIIAPGNSANYRIHYKLPKETDSLALSIMSATAVLPEGKK